MKLWDAKEKFISWRRVKEGSSETIRSYETDIRSLCLYLKNPEIEDIGFDNILQFFKDLKEYGLKPNALARKGNALKSFFEFCKIMNWKVLDPLLVPVSKQKRVKIPRVAKFENYRTLLNSISQEGCYNLRNIAMINLLWDTGARGGEICSLNIDDLDLEQRKGIVITEKSRDDRPRELFWSESTNENLKLYLVERAKLPVGHNALFVTLSHKVQYQRMDISTLGKTLRILSKRAGIETFNAHSCRHAKGHGINDRGGSLVEIHNILGHKTLAASLVYTQMNDKELKKKAEKFMEIWQVQLGRIYFLYGNYKTRNKGLVKKTG